MSSSQLLLAGMNPLQDTMVAVVLGAAFLYGVVLLATARHAVRLFPRELRTSAARRLWFALSIILSLVCAMVLETWTPVFTHPNLTPFILFVPATIFAGCNIIGYALSLRSIRDAIVAGRAPAYAVSADRLWWWDGRQWLGVRAAAPAHAIRSPDGNYWWSGDGWHALPHLPPPKPRGWHASLA